MKKFKRISTYLHLVSHENNTIAEVMGFYEVLLSKVQNVALTVTVGGFVKVEVFHATLESKRVFLVKYMRIKKTNIRIEVGETPFLYPGCSCQRGDWVSTLGLGRASTKWYSFC